MDSDEEDLFIEGVDDKYLKWRDVPKDAQQALSTKLNEFQVSCVRIHDGDHDKDKGGCLYVSE